MYPSETITEFHTTVCSPHPYFGFVCTPNSVLDFSEKVPKEFGHRATAIIDKDGFRNHNLPATKPPDEIWIGLFGGSVAFSVSSTDNEHTISGYLERILNGDDFLQLILPKRRIRVVNYALPGGQQPQQFLIYVFHRKLLDGFITFDGVNEVVIPAYYNVGAVPSDFPYRPYYEAVFARKITEEQAALSWLVEDSNSPFSRPSAIRKFAFQNSPDRRLAQIRDRLKTSSPDTRRFVSMYWQPAMDADCIRRGGLNWRENLLLMDLVGKSAGAEGLAILQPVPERGKKLTDMEASFLRDQEAVLEIRHAGYELLSAQLGELSSMGVNCSDFAEVFSAEAGSVYSDLTHFEDYGCGVVARAIGESLRRSWQMFGGK